MRRLNNTFSSVSRWHDHPCLLEQRKARISSAKSAEIQYRPQGEEHCQAAGPVCPAKRKLKKDSDGNSFSFSPV
jgi:hypothetical protein